MTTLKTQLDKLKTYNRPSTGDAWSRDVEGILGGIIDQMALYPYTEEGEKPGHLETIGKIADSLGVNEEADREVGQLLVRMGKDDELEPIDTHQETEPGEQLWSVDELIDRMEYDDDFSDMATLRAALQSERARNAKRVGGLQKQVEHWKRENENGRALLDETQTMADHDEGEFKARIAELESKLEEARAELKRRAEWVPAPAKCPITGRDHFMNIRTDHGELVPTYGGPYDSYTIPQVDKDNHGEGLHGLSCERFDHDRGHWVEGGDPLGLVLMDDENPLMFEELGATERAEKAEARVKELESFERDAMRLPEYVRGNTELRKRESEQTARITELEAKLEEARSDRDHWKRDAETAERERDEARAEVTRWQKIVDVRNKQLEDAGDAFQSEVASATKRAETAESNLAEVTRRFEGMHLELEVWADNQDPPRSSYCEIRAIRSRFPLPTEAPAIVPREEVMWFARWMELKLRENDHKGGWKRCTVRSLHKRAEEELSELEATFDDDFTPENTVALIREAADVANMVMMVADNASRNSLPEPLVNESDLLVSQCNNSEACEKRRVAREVYPGDPLDALRELRDDLAHDEDRTFVNTANEVIDRWSNERTQHTAQLAERDARIAELERDQDKVIKKYKAATDRMNRFWREREAYRDKFRGLREAVDRMRGRATLCGSAASWVVAGLWNILDRFPVDEPSEPEQGEG